MFEGGNNSQSQIRLSQLGDNEPCSEDKGCQASSEEVETTEIEVQTTTTASRDTGMQTIIEENEGVDCEI